MRAKLTIALLSTIAIAGCESAPKNPQNFQYWQRVSASSAIHMQGPKAQQSLHRDIARCVTEVKEMDRLNKTQNALRVDPRTGRILDPDQKKMRGYDTPEYNGYLLSEHSNYHDFPSCMSYKGWERTRNISYEVAERGRDNYIGSLESYGYQSNIGKKHDRIRNENQAGGQGLN